LFDRNTKLPSLDPRSRIVPGPALDPATRIAGVVQAPVACAVFKPQGRRVANTETTHFHLLQTSTRPHPPKENLIMADLSKIVDDLSKLTVSKPPNCPSCWKKSGAFPPRRSYGRTAASGGAAAQLKPPKQTGFTVVLLDGGDKKDQRHQRGSPVACVRTWV
jgi:hypothetical protein